MSFTGVAITMAISLPSVDVLQSNYTQSLPSTMACMPTGFRSTRRTKIICTIGPKSSSTEMLGTLAAGGMNVARLNMSHGDHEWHKTVIDRIRKLNKDKGYVHRKHMLAGCLHDSSPIKCIFAMCSYSVAIMMDTEGSEVHLHELKQPYKAEVTPSLA